MRVGGFQKLTLLDYPKKSACIIFTMGCNFNCSYCQNSDFIGLNNSNLIKIEDIFSYLNKRKNILDGVVITGGEPTIHKDLPLFIKKIKEMGYLVKLDTNGTNPNMLEELINNNLVDYIAMDIKNNFKDYEKVTKKNFNLDNIRKSISLIKQSKVDYEFRTTIIKNYHSINNILEICDFLGDEEKIYLQNFENSDGVRDKSLLSFSKDELKNIEKNIKNKFPNVTIRGL